MIDLKIANFLMLIFVPPENHSIPHLPTIENFDVLDRTKGGTEACFSPPRRPMEPDLRRLSVQAFKVGLHDPRCLHMHRMQRGPSITRNAHFFCPELHARLVDHGAGPADGGRRKSPREHVLGGQAATRLRSAGEF